jgi:hypothetical protein
MALRQLTIRGLDAPLEQRVRALAREQRISLNRAVLHLLRRGAGLAPPSREPRVVGGALDHLIGTWSKAQREAFDRAVAVFEQVDDEAWR